MNVILVVEKIDIGKVILGNLILIIIVVANYAI